MESRESTQPAVTDLPRSMNDRSTTRCCQLPRLALHKGVEEEIIIMKEKKGGEEREGEGTGQPVKKRKRREEKSRGRRGKKAGGTNKAGRSSHKGKA